MAVTKDNPGQAQSIKGVVNNPKATGRHVKIANTNTSSKDTADKPLPGTVLRKS